MADKPWKVGFVGTGDSNKNNVVDNLNDWMAPDGDFKPPVVPDSITEASKGLQNVLDWLDEEFGSKNVDELRLDEIVPALVKARDTGAEPYLVYIPELIYVSDEVVDQHLTVVRAAIDAGIPVKDLNAGLDDYQLPEPEPEEEPAPRRRRGQPRTEVFPDEGSTATAAEIRNDPPWEVTPEDARDAVVSTPGQATGVTVMLSQETINTLVQLASRLAGDVKAAVVAEIPGAKPKTYPFWLDEDGNYRPVQGRGRPKKGETKVELTEAEIRQVPGLEVPE